MATLTGRQPVVSPAEETDCKHRVWAVGARAQAGHGRLSSRLSRWGCFTSLLSWDFTDPGFGVESPSPSSLLADL